MCLFEINENLGIYETLSYKFKGLFEIFFFKYGLFTGDRSIQIMQPDETPVNRLVDQLFIRCLFSLQKSVTNGISSQQNQLSTSPVANSLSRHPLSQFLITLKKNGLFGSRGLTSFVERTRNLPRFVVVMEGVGGVTPPVLLCELRREGIIHSVNYGLAEAMYIRFLSPASGTRFRKR